VFEFDLDTVDETGFPVLLCTAYAFPVLLCTAYA
jgi:hypothetical protein